ncbi:MAG: alcohol dehydrogenase catalytic domain-containing protein [Thermoanaerobaculia bacterium]|nr:alcohol dehydrogenase catalytic domain-containing protein [Thermoanaerobaculia bacterium]
MRAVVKSEPVAGTDGTEVRDVPIPSPGPDEVLIRVAAAALCGTDKHIFKWDPSIQRSISPPRVYGHEFCGFVERIGERVESPSLFAGAYVSAEMHLVCGVCPQCRRGEGHICRNTRILGIHGDGAFADYVCVPASNVIPLNPRYVPIRVGAFLDALGNAVHTTQVTDLAGKSVAITGFGPIGAMAAAIAEHSGATTIIVTDISDHALETARRWAAHLNFPRLHAFNMRTTDESEVRSAIEVITDGNGVDVVLEMSGASPAINFGFDIVRMGGTVSLLGLPAGNSVTIDNYTRNLVFKGISVHGIIGRRMYDTWQTMLALLEGGLDVTWVVQGEFEGLEQFNEAMEIFDEGSALKVVLYPNGIADAKERLASLAEQ